MRTVLVTATRGDGGQNEIGPEIFQALGVLRTEELLAVHRFDGAEQYFTRAIDFGYSFSIDESIQKWGHDEIVGDLRASHPRHSSGRHRRLRLRRRRRRSASPGVDAADASKRSARPRIRSRYPEQIREGLRPWQAKRVFCTEGFARPSLAAPAPVTSSRVVDVRDSIRCSAGRTASSASKRAACTSARARRSCCCCLGERRRAAYRLEGQRHRRAGRRAGGSCSTGIDTTLAGLAAYAGPQPPAGADARRFRPSADVVAAATRAVDNERPRRGRAAARQRVWPRCVISARKLATLGIDAMPHATRSTSGWRRRSRSSRTRCC